EQLPRNYEFVFEFRHPSWYHNDVYSVLHAHNAAFCFFDKELKEIPLEITANHIYVRLHGSGPEFGGNYIRRHLEVWARRIEEWKNRVREIWFYFNNDWHGYAIDNALELSRLLTL